MPEWHHLDLSSTMPQQQESTKKKTLKSCSGSFWFSTGLDPDKWLKKISKLFCTIYECIYESVFFLYLSCLMWFSSFFELSVRGESNEKLKHF